MKVFFEHSPQIRDFQTLLKELQKTETIFKNDFHVTKTIKYYIMNFKTTNNQLFSLFKPL